MKKRQTKNKQKLQTKNLSSSAQAATTFADHVVELRNRAMWLGLVFLIFSALAYNYHEVLLKVIMAPLNGEKLVYLTPGGGFSFIFLVSMYTGLIATIPLLIYHLHAFIKPALPERARRSAARIIISATMLIVAGVSYGYFIAIPAALHFLTTFAGDAVTPNLTADSYLSFFLAYIAGLAALSLLPLFLMFAHWIHPLKPSGLLKTERWVILFAFIAAALITPTPDVVNQSMIALPVIGIYQLGVVAIFVATVQDKRRQRIADAYHAEVQVEDELVESIVAEARSTVSQSEPMLEDDLAIEEPVFEEPREEPKAIPHPVSAAMQIATPAPAAQKRVTRSVDGFRTSSIRVAPRSRQVRPRSIDGMTFRRSNLPES